MKRAASLKQRAIEMGKEIDAQNAAEREKEQQRRREQELEIERVNQRKLERMKEIRFGDSKIHTLSRNINSEFKILFTQTQQHPEMIKVLADIQMAIADLAAKLISRIPSRFPAGQTFFLPSTMNPSGEPSENSWVSFVKGVHIILREAAAKNQYLLRSTIYNGLLTLTDNLSMNPNMEPPPAPPAAAQPKQASPKGSAPTRPSAKK